MRDAVPGPVALRILTGERTNNAVPVPAVFKVLAGARISETTLVALVLRVLSTDFRVLREAAAVDVTR